MANDKSLEVFWVESYVPLDVVSNRLGSDVGGSYSFKAHKHCGTSERRCYLLEHYLTFDQRHRILTVSYPTFPKA